MDHARGSDFGAGLAPSRTIQAVKCPSCQRKTLDHARDRATGKIVKADGKFMLRCSACSESVIVDRKKLGALKGLAERPSLLWWIAGALGLIGMVAEGMSGWATNHLSSQSSPVLLNIIMGAALSIPFGRMAVWQMIAAREAADFKTRNESYACSVFFLAIAGLMVWAMIVGIGRDRDWARRNPPRPAPTASPSIDPASPLLESFVPLR